MEEENIGLPEQSLGVAEMQSDVITPVVEEKVDDKEFNFKALREEAAKLKADREYWRGQAEALSKQAKPESVEIQEEIDWFNGDHVKRAWEGLRKENENLRAELRDGITAMRTKSQYSDWESRVTKELPELVQKNPIFAEMIKNSSNPYEAAYLLAELNSKTQQAQKPSPVGQRALENAQKPQTLSSLGGQSSLSSADYYSSMSDEDFMKLAGKHLASI